MLIDIDSSQMGNKHKDKSMDAIYDIRIPIIDVYAYELLSEEAISVFKEYDTHLCYLFAKFIPFHNQVAKRVQIITQ